MIKLYTIKDWLTPENRRHVHPLLFDLHYYDHTHSSVYDHYQLVDSEVEADAFILPIDYFMVVKKKMMSEFYEFIKKAKINKKKILVYTSGDYGKTFKNPSIIVWRNAGFKSTNPLDTVILPAFIQDPTYLEYVAFYEHDYTEKPQIGFTGYATDSYKETSKQRVSQFKKNIERFIGKEHSDHQRYYNAPQKRYQYLKELERSPLVKTSFVYRSKYRAGAFTEELRAKTTKEFFQNILNNPYTFCLRGAGNFSVRFFESLACGRIPVLVDTDVQLPLENQIPWSKHICYIKENEDLVTQLLDFHNTFTDDSFKQLQRSNRLLFEELLVRHKFFCKLHDHLKYHIV